MEESSVISLQSGVALFAQLLNKLDNYTNEELNPLEFVWRSEDFCNVGSHEVVIVTLLINTINLFIKVC
jgi:hypothetical protein